MRGFVTALVALAMLWFTVEALTGPSPKGDTTTQFSFTRGQNANAFQVGFVSDSVRATLRTAWDDKIDAAQDERIYCVHYTSVSDGYVTEYTVDGILPVEGDSTVASPVSSKIHCPDSWPVMDIRKATPGLEIKYGITTLHTHPPTTCDKDLTDCVFGGKLAWECFPSMQDLRYAGLQGRPFELVQCDANAFVFFGFSQILRVPQGWVQPGRYHNAVSQRLFY